MSINKQNSNNVPRQLPILIDTIEIIQDIVDQGINGWSSHLELTKKVPVKYPTIVSSNEYLQGDIGKDNIDLHNNKIEKISRWIQELTKLGWSPQILSLYYAFVLDYYRQNSNVIKELYDGIELEIDIETGMEIKSERVFFGYSPTDFLIMKITMAGQETSLLDAFLSKINPRDKGQDITNLKESVRTQAETHPDILVAIESAIKVQVIIETGKMTGILEQND